MCMFIYMWHVYMCARCREGWLACVASGQRFILGIFYHSYLFSFFLFVFRWFLCQFVLFFLSFFEARFLTKTRLTHQTAIESANSNYLQHELYELYANTLCYYFHAQVLSSCLTSFVVSTSTTKPFHNILLFIIAYNVNFFYKRVLINTISKPNSGCQHRYSL